MDGIKGSVEDWRGDKLEGGNLGRDNKIEGHLINGVKTQYSGNYLKYMKANLKKVFLIMEMTDSQLNVHHHQRSFSEPKLGCIN